MRGISLSLLAVLAMSGVVLADPVLNYEVTNYYPGSGVRTFTVYATGLNINTLAAFSVDGVNQVWTAPATISEWDNSPNTPANPVDSYVVFGDLRLADLNGIAGGPWGPTVTTETITGGGVSGVGTLVNGGASPDAYIVTGVPADDPNERVDLFQLAVPKGKAVDVTATLHSALPNPANPPWYDLIETYRFDDEVGGLGSLTVKSVLDGDANSDGIVNSTDLSLLLSSYNQSGKVWATGDFSGDGNANSTDLSLLLGNYNQSADWYGSAAPGGEAAGAGGTTVPEPGTLVMLVLGSLCLAGYRLRK